ncbi:MAG TPA: methyltransferase domain-containing protein [Phycisphaerae bacterium]|nr:methyltransferase domain-containing protein [Phycisphaerae bacterium]HUU84552.1 methyltransferase domain-containing protein [Phycisphaerae bacterium]
MLDDTQLCAELLRYLNAPRPQPCGEYDQVREMLVCQELMSSLNHDPERQIRILDVGFGERSVFRLLVSHFNDDRQRLAYVGLDSSIDAVSRARLVFEGNSGGWHEPPVFEVGDILADRSPAEDNKFDFVFLLNTLHEIPAHRCIDLLTKLVQKTCSNGRVLIIDMVALPTGQEELCAISWSAQEVLDLAKAGGFRASVIPIERAVSVFALEIDGESSVPPPETDAASAILRTKLLSNLDRLMRARAEITTQGAVDNEQALRLVKILGETAITSDALRRLERGGT